MGTAVDFGAARWQRDSEGTWLCLRLEYDGPALRFIDAMESGKQYTAELSAKRKRRSLDANAYAWVLIGKLAAKLNISPIDIYRQYVPDIGGNYTIVPVREDRLEHWEKIWCSGHLGRMVKDIGPCKSLVGYHNIVSYLGSSDYDTAQMSRLIDLIVQDCKAQSIEVLTPRELDAIKEAWK